MKVVVRGSTESAMKKLRMDQDVSAELLRLLKKSGVEIIEGVTIKEFISVPVPGDTKGLIRMALNDGSILESDIFFAATGRYPVGCCEKLVSRFLLYRLVHRLLGPEQVRPSGFPRRRAASPADIIPRLRTFEGAFWARSC